MKIVVGSDHGGYELKEQLKARLAEQGHEGLDVGCGGEPVDYPDIAVALSRVVLEGQVSFGILCCGTGIGISMAANKIKGIRCALLSDTMTARLTREHNDTNMMALGAGVTGPMLAQEIVDVWLETEFSHNERHQRRIDKVMALENL